MTERPQVQGSDFMLVLIRAFNLVLIALALASCNLVSGPTPAPASNQPTPVPPTATPASDPKAIAAEISKATAATETVHFAITLSGKAVYSDPSQQFTLLSMEGDLKRPDSILATIKVRSTGSLIDVHTISLAGKQYVTNPINRQWLCAAPGQLFDPVVLFDANRGVEHLLRDHFEDVRFVAVEDLNGRPHYHLQGTFPGDALRAISYNSLGAGPVAVDVWADKATMQATQLILVDSATDTAKPSTWKLIFSDYNKDVEVRPPTQC